MFVTLVLVKAALRFSSVKPSLYWLESKEKEFEDWSNKVNVELQDLDILLTNATALSLSFYQKDLLEALIDDNTDSLGRVLEFDVNRGDIDRHIDNAKDFLRKECRMTVT